MKYFGTDGFRGRANIDLTVDHAFKIGKYLGWYFCKKIKCNNVSCVIGKDTRKSSYMFEYALAAGLSSTGANVYLLHVTTTPNVSYVVKTENFNFGIMVTASHNPFFDNGIKIIDKYGYKMDEALLLEIEDYLDNKIDIEIAKNEDIGKITDYMQGRNKYISFLMSSTMFSFRGFRVGLDCANGSSSNIAKTVFETLGAEVKVINNNPNGININDNCGSTNLSKLKELVVENKLDIGFAFDGDADRCIAVDENGNEVDGDKIIYIYSRYLYEKSMLVKNTAVATILTNMGIEKSLKKEGIELKRTAVGDKYISQLLKENDYSIGGEQSGHIIFNKYGTTGDGILTAIKLLEVLADKKSTFSLLYSGLEMYPQYSKNIRVNDMDVVLNNTALKLLIKDIENDLGEKGRLIIRKSGTEPLIRIMVEHQQDEVCIQNVERIIDCIEKIKN